MNTSRILNTPYYFAVSLEDDWEVIGGTTRELYAKQFLERSKLCEYKVELVEVTLNDPNRGQLCHTYKILDILSQNGAWWVCEKENEAGSRVYGYDDYKHCDLPWGEISYMPQCAINDGGCLNCGGCYRSLVIPWDLYETYRERFTSSHK